MIRDSFNDVKLTLETKYVDNNDFFLYINDEELEDVDPYDKNLDDDMKQRIMTECKNNFWYFLRNVVKVPKVIGEIPDDKLEPDIKYVDFDLTLTSLIRLWCCLKKLNNYSVEKPENYDYTDISILLIWKMIFDDDLTEIVINNKHGGSAIEIYDLIESIYNNLPSYMSDSLIFGDYYRILRDDRLICHVCEYTIRKDNIELIRRENDGKISVYPDFEYMPINVDLLYPYDTNDNNFDIILSTPNEKITTSGNDIISFIGNSLKWSAGLFDLTDEMIRETLICNSMTHTIYLGYTYIGPKNSNVIQLIPGPRGYNPKKGVDYWNEEDIEEINKYINKRVYNIVKAMSEESADAINEFIPTYLERLANVMANYKIEEPDDNKDDSTEEDTQPGETEDGFDKDTDNNQDGDESKDLPEKDDTDTKEPTTEDNNKPFVDDGENKESENNTEVETPTENVDNNVEDSKTIETELMDETEYNNIPIKFVETNKTTQQSTQSIPEVNANDIMLSLFGRRK